MTVAENAATDGLNTGPAAAVVATAAWDATAPTVAIGGVPARINSTAALSVEFTWSEEVTGFATGDVTVTGGTKGALVGSGTSYTLAVTPASGSNVVLTVADNSATDGVNTGPASAVSATATWDAAAPAVEITGVPARINSRTALSVTFTWSEEVTEFVSGDVTVTGGTKGAFAGSGRTYTLAVTPTGSADVVATVADNSATDGVNTGPAAAVSATAIWDAAAPTVAIGGVPPKINSRTALSVTFTWSEEVTGFATGDVTVAGGAKGAFAGSGKSYTLAVTPSGSADVVVTVAADSATDGLNTGPGSAVAATAVWDAAAPTVAIGGVPPKINSRTALSVTLTWSEEVTGFATGDVTVAGGAKGAFAGSGRTYTLAVTPTGSADVVVTVAADASTDGLNTGPGSEVSATATWDAAAPTVAIGGVPARINSTAALSVEFTWSEEVTGFATGDVTVTGGTKGAFAGSGTSYTLAVTPASGSNVVVTVAANSATDGVNTGPGSEVSDTAIWDAAAPAVEITGVPAKINSRTALSVTFTWSEEVTGFVSGDVTVTGGTKGAFAGSGTSYTLAVTPASGSNVVVTVAANSATDGTNTGPASAVSDTAVWDAAAPAVEITGVPAKINSTTALSATFTWSEEVTGFVSGDVTVTGGTKGAFAGSGTSYTLAVTPASGSNVVVTVAANSATDGVNTGPGSEVSDTAIWDAAAPAVEITGVPAKINSRTALSVTFTWSEEVTGFVSGDVTVTGGTKGAFAGSGTSYTLAVTPASGSNVVVTVAANSATDGVNTGPGSEVSDTAVWDAAAPAVEITGVPAKINSRTALSVTFTWSEEVTGFVSGDVTVTGGTKGAFAGSGTSYTLAVTPASGSNVVVTVAANSATDGTNTGPASAVSDTAVWDAAAPAVEITGVPAKINSTTALSATFTWSEEVTGFVSGDVTVTGGTKGAFAGSGTSYTLAVTPASGSNVVVTVAANSATDGVNTGPGSEVSDTAIWDAAAPAVEITGVPAKINSRTALSVTFTWSEEVTGFATGDVTVSGGSKGAFAGSGRTYTLAVTPTGSADVVVTVAASSATDGLNTGPAAAVSATATWEAGEPLFAIADASAVEGRPVVFALTRTDAAEAVSGSWTAREDPRAEHPATAGEDFAAASGTLSFEPRQDRATFAVETLADRRSEPPESFLVEVSVAGTRLLTTGTIRDAVGTVSSIAREPGLWLWTDELAYRPGDSVQLYLSIEPNGQQEEYSVFVWRGDLERGERAWLDLRRDQARLEPRATDMHGESDQTRWARRLERVERRMKWEGQLPAPGPWHFVAELRSPTSAQVLKRAYAKLTVAGTVLVARAGFERRLRSDARWASDTIWMLGGSLIVPRGLTLEIEAGTQIRARGPGAQIVVEPGGRIVARGRRDRPIVMTCDSPVGRRERGCWGGVRIFGEAVPEVRAVPDWPDGGSEPGPSAARHSSGELRYVRVEFAGGGRDEAGAAVSLHQVGAGTVLEHVQAHASLGQGFRFEGGAVGCYRCVASNSRQVGVIWEGGYHGLLQNLYVQQAERDSSGLRGLGGPESGPGPWLYNATLVGGGYGPGRPGGAGIRLDGTAALHARNVIATGFRGYGIEAGADAAENFAAGVSSVTNAIFQSNDRGVANARIAPFVAALRRLPRLLNVRVEPNPDPRPRSGSAALVPHNAAVPPYGGPNYRRAPYLGAFGRENWLAQWTWFGREDQYRASE